MIGERKYDGVGNVGLLMEEGFDTVHVRSKMVKDAENGTDMPLRNYMNSRVLMARKGVVMVSPFISPLSVFILPNTIFISQFIFFHPQGNGASVRQKYCIRIHQAN